LRRRHWRNVGVVAGDRLEDAEQRFFGAWVDNAAASGGAVPPPPPSSATPETPGVIGLFPEPGAQR
jgi:hypothetical protein